MSENNITIDPAPTVLNPEPTVPNLASESVRNFVAPVTPSPHKKFPTIFLFLIPVLTIVAVISIYVLLLARTMYQQTVSHPRHYPPPSPLLTQPQTGKHIQAKNMVLVLNIQILQRMSQIPRLDQKSQSFFIN